MAQTLDAQGNVIQNGFSTNLSPTQLTSVNNSLLKSATNLNVPQPQTDTNLPTISSLLQNAQAGQLQEQTNVNSAETGVTQTQNDINAVNKQLEGQTADQLQAERDLGIPGLNKNINDLQNLARQKTLEYQLVGQTTPYSLAGQGRGISTGLLRGQEALIQRQKQSQLAVDALIANSNLEQARGNLTYAQDLADRAIKMKYDPIKQRLENLNAILLNNKENLSRADKKLADAKIQANNLQLKQLDQQIQNQNDINKLIIDASPFAPQDVLKKARDIQAKGGSATEVAQALGVYGKDYLANQYLQEQINAKIKEGQGQNNVSPYQQERAVRTVQSVDELLGQVNNWTTGFGSLLASVPGTDAKNFRAQVDTLIANITFGELTAMREASKTGGALGQVSDREGSLLGAALGALKDRALTPEQYKTQLLKVKNSINRWQTAMGGQELGSKEDNYVQSVVSPSVQTANQKANDPIQMYTSRLIGLPGVK